MNSIRVNVFDGCPKGGLHDWQVLAFAWICKTNGESVEDRICLKCGEKDLMMTEWIRDKELAQMEEARRTAIAVSLMEGTKHE